MSKWEMVKLGDIAEIKSGGTPSRAKSEYWDNGSIPWVKIRDITGEYLNNTSEKITLCGLENSSAKIFEKGTILYTIFATLGECTILNIDASTNQAIAGIKVNEDRINKKFLYFFLKSLKEKIALLGRGVAQNNINLSILKNLHIPLPTLEKQKEIADELDKITNLIEMRKKQIEKLDLLVKSKFIEMFGDPKLNPMKWEKVRLDTLFKVTSSKRIYQEQLRNSGVPFYKVNDLLSKINKRNMSIKNYISEELYEKYKGMKAVPKKNDVLVTTRGTLGESYIVMDNDKFYFQDGMISWLININNSISNVYFIELFKKWDVKNQIHSNSSGATVEYLSIKNLKELEILLPPINLQNQFADYVEKVESTKENLQKSLEQLEILYKQRMQHNFE